MNTPESPVIVKKRLRRKSQRGTPSNSPQNRKQLKRSVPNLEKFVSDNSSINDISGLIGIAEKWKSHKENYRIDELVLEFLDSSEIMDYFKENVVYERLLWIIEELRELDGLIGLGSLKGSIIDQIIFFVQNLQAGELMHTVLYGEQGCGKTTVGEIMARMYSKLGILTKGTFRIARRDDFVAGYLGQTAIKTKKLLDSCKGGVLFIDEAYSLGPNGSDNDSFAKEAIDTLNQFLSENYNDFICIIAGYEKNLNDNFFSQNPGLDRRFPWKFNIDKYSTSELFNIFKHNFSGNWICDVDDKCEHLFNTKDFTNNGGDCKIIYDRCKIFHGRRMFNSSGSGIYTIKNEDVENAVIDFMKTKKKINKDVPVGIYM